MISYLDYKASTLGQSMIGDNPVDSGECNGYIQKFLVSNGIQHIPGNAIDIYTNAPSNLFDKLPPDAQVRQGDIFCCGKPWGWNAQAKIFDGHIGFVDQPMQGQSFLGLEQNGTFNPPHKVQLVFHQQRNGFLGFLRLKEMVMDKNDAIAFYRGTLHRAYPTQVSDNEINGLVGRKLSDIVAQELNSPEWLTQNYWILEGATVVAQLNEKIQQLQNSPSQQEIDQLKQEVATLTDTVSKLENKQ